MYRGLPHPGHPSVTIRSRGEVPQLGSDGLSSEDKGARSPAFAGDEDVARWGSGPGPHMAQHLAPDASRGCWKRAVRLGSRPLSTESLPPPFRPSPQKVPSSIWEDEAGAGLMGRMASQEGRESQGRGEGRPYGEAVMGTGWLGCFCGSWG